MLVRQANDLEKRRLQWAQFRAGLDTFLAQYPDTDTVLDGANIGHHNQNFSAGEFSHGQIDDLLSFLEQESVGRHPVVIIRERWLRKDKCMNAHLQKMKKPKLAPLVATAGGEKPSVPVAVSSPLNGAAVLNKDDVPAHELVTPESPSSGGGFRRGEFVPAGPSSSPAGDAGAAARTAGHDVADLPAARTANTLVPTSGGDERVGSACRAALGRCYDKTNWVPAALRWDAAGHLFVSPSKLNDDWIFLYVAIKISLKKGSKINPLWLVSNDQMRDHFWRLGGDLTLLHWRELHGCKFSIVYPDRSSVFPEEQCVCPPGYHKTASKSSCLKLLPPRVWTPRMQRLEDGRAAAAPDAVHAASGAVLRGGGESTWMVPFLPSTTENGVRKVERAEKRQRDNAEQPDENSLKEWRWMAVRFGGGSGSGGA